MALACTITAAFVCVGFGLGKARSHTTAAPRRSACASEPPRRSSPRCWSSCCETRRCRFSSWASPRSRCSASGRVLMPGCSRSCSWSPSRSGRWRASGTGRRACSTRAASGLPRGSERPRSVAVNNLPATVLLTGQAPAHPFALLLGLDLGPNLAVTGSLSAVLWLQAARSVGARPSIATYTRFGVVLVPLTLAVTVAVSSWSYRRRSPPQRLLVRHRDAAGARPRRRGRRGSRAPGAR